MADPFKVGDEVILLDEEREATAWRDDFSLPLYFLGGKRAYRVENVFERSYSVHIIGKPNASGMCHSHCVGAGDRAEQNRRLRLVPRVAASKEDLEALYD